MLITSTSILFFYSQGNDSTETQYRMSQSRKDILSKGHYKREKAKCTYNVMDEYNFTYGSEMCAQ